MSHQGAGRSDVGSSDPAMQSKGYSLGAIAKMFSENGIVVTAVTLKSYLNQVKPRRGKKGSQKQTTSRGR